MKTKHTKGEWKIQDFFSTPNEICIFLGDATKQTVLVKGDNCEANAKLIASASELLEALIEAKQVIDNLTKGKSELLAKPCKIKINNAIKKATT